MTSAPDGYLTPGSHEWHRRKNNRLLERLDSHKHTRRALIDRVTRGVNNEFTPLTVLYAVAAILEDHQP